MMAQGIILEFTRCMLQGIYLPPMRLPSYVHAMRAVLAVTAGKAAKPVDLVLQRVMIMRSRALGQACRVCCCWLSTCAGSFACSVLEAASIAYIYASA
jgi:hypothetical protein